MAALSEDKRLEIERVSREHPHWGGDKIAAVCGVTKDTARKYRIGERIKDEPPTLTEQNEISGDTWSISIPKTTICTEEELVKHCKIDLIKWEIDRLHFKKWDIGAKEEHTTGYGKDRISNSRLVVKELFAVTAFLKKRKWAEEAQRVIDHCRKLAESHAPKYPKVPKNPSKSGNVVEISPVDVHHGALIWGKETGGEDWDLKISERTYKEAVTALIARTEDYRPERALLVLGHDQQNADNRAGNTEAGTPQNNDGRYQKVFDLSVDCSIWAIDTCLLKYGAVEVRMIPGNHDALSTWHLGRVLQSWYRKCPQVTIHNSPNMRQYWEHGVNMLLLTHGNKGNLEQYGEVMAAEQPEMWGRTKFREAHTGDKHKRRLIEGKGATVRILPSLRPPCAWSAENHYVGSIRAAEAYVWNKDEGLIGTAMYSVLK